MTHALPPPALESDDPIHAAVSRQGGMSLALVWGALRAEMAAGVAGSSATPRPAFDTWPGMPWIGDDGSLDELDDPIPYWPTGDKYAPPPGGWAMVP